MSGIYIHDMKMPENCFQCPAHEWFDFGGENHGYQCPILRTTTCISNCEARTKRRDNCPLIPVPDHGRLIDADKIGLTDFEIIMCQQGNPYKNALESLLEKLEKAPTVITTDKEVPI